MSLTPAELGLANELYNQLMRQITPPFPAVTVPTEQEAPNHNGAVAVPYVNSMFKDDE